MSDEPVVDVLNALLAGEQQSLAPRLFESTVFVSNASVAAVQIARRLSALSRANQQALAERVIALGGTPVIRRGNVRSADLHYQELRAIVPRLLNDHERLAELYRVAGEHVSGDAESAKLVARLLAGLDQELQALRDLAGQLNKQPTS